MGNNRFTPAQRKAIATQWVQGVATSTLTQRHDISRATLAMWADLFNLPRPRTRPDVAIPEEKKREALRLRVEGHTFATIAREVGVCYATTRRICAAAGYGGANYSEMHARTLHRRELAVGMRREGKTLQEIGDHIGVTRERVRQYLALEKCCPMCGCKFHPNGGDR